MMTEEPESYQRMLHSLVSRAQQVQFLFKCSIEIFGFFWKFGYLSVIFLLGLIYHSLTPEKRVHH